jgi:hypothetical protein
MQLEGLADHELEDVRDLATPDSSALTTVVDRRFEPHRRNTDVGAAEAEARDVEGGTTLLLLWLLDA